MAAVLACAPVKPDAGSTPVRASSFHYEINVSSDFRLAVELTVRGPIRQLQSAAPSGVENLRWSSDNRSWRQAALVDGSVDVECPASCKIRYDYDLAGLAEWSGDDAAFAVRARDAVVAPAGSFLLVGRPSDVNAAVTLRFVPNELEVDAPFRMVGGAFELRAWEVKRASYVVIGKRLASRPVPIGTRMVYLHILRDSTSLPSAATDEQWAQWVVSRGELVASLYGEFPAERLRTFIVERPWADGLSFGRTLPSGGAAIFLSVEPNLKADHLDADWIFMHELVHLGVPSFYREGEWLDEGLATYYEAVLRTRAGWQSSAALWRTIAQNTAGGTIAPGDVALAVSEDRRHIYQGGMLAALWADVAIRRRSDGRRSLDDAVRAVYAEGGNAETIWSLARFVEVADAATGGDELAVLLERASRSGFPSDSDRHDLLLSLGVDPTTGAISQTASGLVDLRIAIETGRP